jgi:DNA primase
MNAVEFLTQHLDMEKVMEHYGFSPIHHYGSMIRSCCAIHGGNNPTGFVVNKHNNLWYCHTGDCGGGDVYTLIQRVENVSFVQAVPILASILGIDIENMEILERKETWKKEVEKWMITMKKLHTNVLTEEFHVMEELKNVTKFRNFQPETIEHFGLKYVETIRLKNKQGDWYTLYQRLFFPIVENGIQIGASLRRIKSTDMPKWSHQPVQLETKHILYNFDAVKHEPIIVICEGMIDVWAYHEIGISACATFGAHVTEEQYRKLIKTGAELVWSFDGDEAGLTATNKAIELFRYKANQYIVPFLPHEDPASISREELQKRYEGKERKL